MFYSWASIFQTCTDTVVKSYSNKPHLGKISTAVKEFWSSVSNPASSSTTFSRPILQGQSFCDGILNFFVYCATEALKIVQLWHCNHTNGVSAVISVLSSRKTAPNVTVLHFTVVAMEGAIADNEMAEMNLQSSSLAVEPQPSHIETIVSRPSSPAHLVAVISWVGAKLLSLVSPAPPSRMSKVEVSGMIWRTTCRACSGDIFITQLITDHQLFSDAVQLTGE